MKGKTISYTFNTRQGKGWKEAYRTEDPARVYEHLARMLMNHKVFHMPYIKRVEQRNLYDGTREITAYMDTGKERYIVEA